MKRLLDYGFILGLAVMMAACSDSDNGENIENPEPQPPTPVVTLLTADEQAVLPGVNAAQLEFFEKVYKNADPDENVICSPLSAQVLLSMLANVTEPVAAAEICSALGCENQELLNSLNAKLMGAMKNASPVTFKPANALWYDTQFALSDAGKNLIAGSYSPETFARDFSDGSVVGEINKWCAERTDDLITKLFDEGEELKVFALLNALYFYGPWANEFDVNETRDKDFYGESGTTSVKMMYNEDYVGVFMDYTTMMPHGVELKCKGGQYVVDYILPPEGQTLDDFISAENIRQVFTMMGSDNAIYSIPKMKLTPDRIDLKKALADFGIAKVYDPEAIRMFTEAVTLKDVYQKSAVEIDEKGAKAASVSVGTGLETAPMAMPVVIDRPFVMLIREVSTGTILFAGAVRNL